MAVLAASLRGVAKGVRHAVGAEIHLPRVAAVQQEAWLQEAQLSVYRVSAGVSL